MYTNLKTFILLAVFTILSTIILSLNATVIAQEPEVWSDVTNVSDTASSSTYPDIVTDPYGYIHVFWGENLDGPAVDPKILGQEQSNSIVYIRGDNQTWSQPVDLFFTNAGGGYRFPSVDIDSSARLHLVWRSGAGLHYSSAPALQAGNAHAWQSPQLLASAQAQEPARILIDDNDIIHLVYSAWQDKQHNEKDGNIYYIQSTDGGHTWSEPIKLSEVSPATETNASSYDIAVDTQNHIHVVWQHSDPPGFTGSSVHYISSNNGGRSWSVPIEMAQLQGDDQWASAPTVFALPTLEIHFTWVCGNLPTRCHSWSQDGGLNWFPTVKLFGNMHSVAGRDVLTTDGDGNLYWFAQLRYPNAIYYSRWLRGRWADLQMAHGGLLQGGHYSKASTGQGNQINLVTVEQEMKEIYYFQGITAAPVIEPLPTPTPNPTSTPTPQPSPTVALEPTATPRVVSSFEADTPSSANADASGPARAIWIGLIPPLLVIGGTVAIQLLRKS